jgi:hypothetical protein
MERAYRSGNDRLLTFLTLFLTLTVGVETFHFVEHCAQMLQEFVVRTDFSRGLVGQFDLESVHFFFNAVYWLATLTILICWLKRGREVSYTFGLTTAILVLGQLTQSYHLSEHTIRFIAYLQTEQQEQPGIIGKHTNPIVAHFVLNSIVYVPIVWLYFFEKFHLRLVAMLPPVLARRWA